MAASQRAEEIDSAKILTSPLAFQEKVVHTAVDGRAQIRVEHLASHILGRMAARISDDWQRMYGHPIYFLETFVDPERFRGTCYRAANWVLLGKTTGRGKQSNSYVPNRSIKEVLGYPLTKRFRELLGEVG